MKIQLRGKKVAVEKLKKVNKKESSFLSIPDSEEYVGLIKFVGAEASKDLMENQKVYFSKNFQTFSINGSQLCVLDDDQILAIVEE